MPTLFTAKCQVSEKCMFSKVALTPTTALAFLAEHVAAMHTFKADVVFELRCREPKTGRPMDVQQTKDAAQSVQVQAAVPDAGRSPAGR